MNLSIVAYFLIFAFVLGWLFFKVDGFVKTKILMIVAMFYVSSAIIFSFDTYMGWPARNEDVPETMVLTNVLIFDKTDNANGYIYVTGIPCIGKKNVDECMQSSNNEMTLRYLNPMKIFGYVPVTVNTPRIYTFPYTDENRKIFGEARDNIKKGGRSVLRRGNSGKVGEDGKGDGNAEGESKGKGGESGEGTKGAESEGAMDIHVDNEALKDFIRKDTP